jgi:hypothetical protein
MQHFYPSMCSQLSELLLYRSHLIHFLFCNKHNLRLLLCVSSENRLVQYGLDVKFNLYLSCTFYLADVCHWSYIKLNAGNSLLSSFPFLKK